MLINHAIGKENNVECFAVSSRENIYFSKYNLITYPNLYFFLSLRLFNFYLVFAVLGSHDICEAKLSLTPWILEFVSIILYIERDRSRKKKRSETGQRKIFSNVWSSFEKELAESVMCLNYFIVELMWKINFFLLFKLSDNNFFEVI